LLVRITSTFGMHKLTKTPEEKKQRKRYMEHLLQVEHH